MLLKPGTGCRTRQDDVALSLEEGGRRGREQVEGGRLLFGRAGFQPREDVRAQTSVAPSIDDDHGADQDVRADLLQPAVADQSGGVLEAVETTAGFLEVVGRQVGGLQCSDQVGSGLGQSHDVEGHQQASFFGAVSRK
jgi:hypothetical protein